MGHKSDIPLLVDGKRIDGRSPQDTREIEIRAKIISRADGSAMARFGKTRVLAAAYGPRELFPRFMQRSDTGIIRTRYAMAPFSVDDRKSPGSDRRSNEISKVMRLALQPALFLEDFPKVTIDVFADVVDADGSTRVTAINAASVALASAGVPMRDLVAACSVGKIDGTLIIDLNGKEDNNSEADVAVAMMPTKKLITLLQMDGVLSRDEIHKLLSTATEALSGKVYEAQKNALKEIYKEDGKNDA